jgi:C-terminal processing protease CtpA/Prc
VKRNLVPLLGLYSRFKQVCTGSPCEAELRLRSHLCLIAKKLSTMKKLIFIIGLIISVNSFSQKKIDKEDLISDIDFLINKYEKIHPNLYAYQSENVFKNEIQKLKKELNDSLTSFDLWLKLSPIINSLKHGHTDVGVNQEDAQIVFGDFLNKGFKFLPFSVYLIDGNVYVREVYTDSSDLKPGDKILSINSEKIETIIKKIMGYQSGELLQYRLSNVERTFIWDYSLYNPSTIFEVTYQSKNKSKSTKLNGIPYEDTEKYNAEVFKELPKYSFEVIKDSIGLISYNSCEGIDKNVFINFLDSTFSVLKQKEIQNLIIDLRQNGGGNSDLNSILLQYVYDKPFSSYKSIDVKITEDIRKLHEFYAKYKNDTIIQLDVERNNSDKINKYFFSGNVFILTSIHTFSSGADCAMLFKDYRIGTIIGQETGGLPSSYGDSYYFKLPNSGLEARVSFKTFIRPSGINDGKGVLPDVPINYTIDDLLDKKDLEMEYVLNQIHGE